jgi:hypothetical protein
MSAPTESQHLAEFVVGTTAGLGLQPAVRCALAARVLATHPNHDLAQRALSRVDDDLCRRVTNHVPSSRFEAKAYKPRGVDLVIPCVLDHGEPPRRKHRGEARIPRSDDVPSSGGGAAAAAVVPPEAQQDPGLADPNRYVQYHELAALEQRLLDQLQTMSTNIQNNMATMQTDILAAMNANMATMQTNILATMNANMATMQTDVAALLRQNGLTP